MHPSFLKILCCPITQQNLHLTVSESNSDGIVMTGTLSTVDGIEYPIIRGIPRFVTEEYYASSFGYEWNRWPRVQFESDNIGKPMEGHTTRMWETITDVAEEKIRDKTIVEFGCGSGRFLDVVRSKGGIAVGIDISQAVEAARRNFANDPNVLIVQADLNNPPFRTEVFDSGYSIGVLHHTPEPVEGLKALVNTVKPGGWVACCVYPKGEFYDYPSVQRLRKIHNSLKSRFDYRPSLAYTYLSAYFLTPILVKSKQLKGLSRIINYLEKNWLVILDIPDRRWRVLDIFDAITPAIATTHTFNEVVSWMKDADCSHIRATSWCNTSIVAIKSSIVEQSEVYETSDKSAGIV
jgi:SAM-dependent methyltransferase